MKKALIVLANPNGMESFCGALAQMSAEVLQAAGYDVVTRDLYAEGFNPVLSREELAAKNEDVSGEWLADIQQVVDSEFYVVIHPNWWGMPPAILKGWIDRVVRQGFCYNFTEAGPVRHLEGHRAVVFTTGNTPQEIEDAFNGDPLENLWKNIVWKTVGVDDFVRMNITPIIGSTLEQRQTWLAEAKALLETRVK